MEPKVAFRGAVNRTWSANQDPSSRLPDAFNTSMLPAANSVFDYYKSQSEDNVDPPNTPPSSSTDYSSGAEPPLFYAPWPNYGEESNQPSSSQTSVKNRAQTDRNDFGSETDLYGLVSNILEEQDKPQPGYAEGACSANIKSIWPGNPGHPGLPSDPQRPVEAAGSPSAFYSGESGPAAEKPAPQRSILTPQPRRDDLCAGFPNLGLEDQWRYPSRADQFSYFNLPPNDPAKAAFQDGPRPQNRSLPLMGLPREAGAAGGDPHSYGRGHTWARGLGAPMQQKRAEMFLAQARLNDSADYCSFPEYPHPNQVRFNQCSNLGLQEGRKSTDGAPKRAAGEAESYARSFLGMPADLKKGDEARGPKNFPFPRSATYLTEKPYAKEAAFVPDFGLRPEYGLKALFARPGLSDFPSPSERQQVPRSEPQNSGFLKPANPPPNWAAPSGGININRPIWMNFPAKNSAPIPYRNQSNLMRWNGHLSPALGGLNHSLDGPPLPPAAAFTPQSYLFQQYYQENPSLFSGLDFGSNGPGRLQPGSPLEGPTRDGGRRLPEPSLEKKFKPPNGPCDGFSPQQYGMVDHGYKHPFQARLQGGHGDPDPGQAYFPGLSPNPYHDLLERPGRYASPRLGSGDNGRVVARPNRPQPSYFPNHFMMGDFRYHPNTPRFGLGRLPPKPSFPFSQAFFPLTGPRNLLSYQDGRRPSPYSKGPMLNDQPHPQPGFPFTPVLPRPVKARSGPASELHTQLEQCYEQWRALEKERKKVEQSLAKNYPGKKVSSMNNTPIPRLTSNPSRVDRLIVDELREQARVVTLLGKMERLRSSPLHINISITLDKHLETIRLVQTRRKEEIVNVSTRQRQGAPRSQDDRDVLALALAVREMCGTTRTVRTTLWCALQMTLPKAAPPQGQADEEKPPKDEKKPPKDEKKPSKDGEGRENKTRKSKENRRGEDASRQ
ncbi:meiosis-specific coiled-coil domain-containing protein MEIOC [Tachyglossus aculeatus]|uniref:meiosis-specific coiled-coil domain-containing protein MEIOC n=1 Tax=Tachyglossus aculeatus TaxID=9261 RepID=UPI0018F67BF6|nr:meiosis-specific coiled-coil domain-containing protein MEIOC [Tachyglossus aculeatus]